MDVVFRALAADPRRRFPTAADFLRALGTVEIPWDPASSRQVLASLIRRLQASVQAGHIQLATGSSLEDVLEDQLT